MKINILGTEYEIVRRKYDEDPAFKEHEWCAYCDAEYHSIVMCELSTYPGWENNSKEKLSLFEKETLRHEIVHAFFNESGLKESSFRVDGAWARNEEMVDWFAIQGPKIYKAWAEAGAV